MKKFRSFLAGLLLVPVLALNADPLGADASLLGADADGLTIEPARQASGWCWIYFGGRWLLIPC